MIEFPIIYKNVTVCLLLLPVLVAMLHHNQHILHLFDGEPMTARGAYRVGARNQWEAGKHIFFCPIRVRVHLSLDFHCASPVISTRCPWTVRFCSRLNKEVSDLIIESNVYDAGEAHRIRKRLRQPDEWKKRLCKEKCHTDQAKVNR